MKRIHISSGAKWEAIVGYSRVVRAGDRVFVTGTVAFTPDGGIAGEGDAYAQACQAMRNIESALAAAGAGLADVTRTRLFVTDITADWEAVGRAHREFLGETKPATTMVEVSRLIDPRLKVEIEADAVIGFGTALREERRAGAAATDRDLTAPGASAGEQAGADRTSLAIGEAGVNETAAIQALLGTAGLPLPDPRDAPVPVLAAREQGRLVGCVGWERYGDSALLRSLAVAEAARGRGAGTRLVLALSDRLQRAGVRELYLLTAGAQGFFSALGFAPVAREQAPALVAASREFSIHACDQAACMRAALPLAASDLEKL
jgi:enamine deaminase RidA (YjgF/YER057c/UK114 family)/N-acetylglutamate synthase-like GNAT family acetyltransferase